MAKKTITLYIDDSSLRLMIIHGKEIREWADCPLELGLIKDNVIIKEAEVANKIRQLLKACNVNTGKVAIGISGLHCFTRPISFPQLPKEMLGEAVEREARRVLPVPLEQLYISWQAIPAPEGNTQLFLVAVPRKTTDALFKTVNQTGLKPYFLDIKPLLVARVVREATAVIVDVQKAEFDVIVMAGGIPQPIRSMPFVGETLSIEEKLTAIINELNRTITFYNSSNPEKELASSVPIFASGELANELDSCQALSEKIGHPVLPLSSPLESRGEFTPSFYVANIGLAIQNLFTGRDAGPSRANLNALPIPYQPKPVSLFNIGSLTISIVAAILVVLMLILIQGASSNIASIREQLSITNQLLTQTSSQSLQLVDNIAELEAKITEVEGSLVNLTTVLDALEKQSTGIIRDLEVTISALPVSVNLTSVNHADSNLIISGWAPSEDEMLSYLEGLTTSGRFGEITLVNMNRIEDTLDFTLVGRLEKVNIEVSIAEIVIRSLPTNVILTGIDEINNSLIILGNSQSEYEVLSYLRNLDGSGKFIDVTITNTSIVESDRIDFSFILTVGE
ncbi:PilN domain-containing protein [Chloroflexota bacterium]